MLPYQIANPIEFLIRLFRKEPVEKEKAVPLYATWKPHIRWNSDSKAYQCQSYRVAGEPHRCVLSDGEPGFGFSPKNAYYWWSVRNQQMAPKSFDFASALTPN